MVMTMTNWGENYARVITWLSPAAARAGEEEDRLALGSTPTSRRRKHRHLAFSPSSLKSESGKFSPRLSGPSTPDVVLGLYLVEVDLKLHLVKC